MNVFSMKFLVLLNEICSIEFTHRCKYVYVYLVPVIKFSTVEHVCVLLVSIS